MSVMHSPDFVASCECGYESTVLSMRGRTQPASCLECGSLINATRRLFRFDYEPCPRCDSTVKEEWLFGNGWYREGRVASIPCPRCGSTRLSLRDIGGPPYLHVDRIPSEGDAIHAELRSRGKITVPDLYTEKGSVWFTKTPKLHVGTRIVATVVALTTMAVNVGKIEAPQKVGVRDLEIRFESCLQSS